MALLKNFRYPNGTETNYHKISELRVLPKKYVVHHIPKEPDEVREENQSETVTSYMITVTLCSYVSRTVRESGSNNYLHCKNYSFEISEEQMLTEPIMKISYDKIKSLQEFEGAVDV